MSDLIRRQDAIDALEREKTYCTAFRDRHMPINVFENYNAGITDGIKALKNLPSAEKPFKLPEIYVVDGFDTIEDEDGNIGFGVYAPAENQIYVVGDVEDEIRARVLLHEVCHWVQAMCGRPFDEDEANEFSDIVYDALPSAQPEIIRCKDCKHLQKWRSEESAKKFGQIYECVRNVLDHPKPEDFCSRAERRTG